MAIVSFCLSDADFRDINHLKPQLERRRFRLQPEVVVLRIHEEGGLPLWNERHNPFSAIRREAEASPEALSADRSSAGLQNTKNVSYGTFDTRSF